MYTNFFSLSELPFSISPDPKYLFMSDRHREALTHLTHGLGGASSSSTGGFVLLTGEVGTGKTTVSRCLMADLPDKTQLAFILNPTLSSQELLATICDQLKVRYRKTGATLKTLTDKLSEKLLKNHADDINTLLIIDEAQHLEPQVLEQLRLLTNLETNTKKLLQVILIGQPELQQLLKRRDLRQLAQRITARYHLLPLDKSELTLYIKHRLSVADCHRALFNKGALAAIHQLSQGIPRLINLICHSALMEAYNSNNAVVDKKIVLKAASNALGDDFLPPSWWQYKSVKTAVVVSLLLVVSMAGYWFGQKEPLSLAVSERIENLDKQVVELNVKPPVEKKSEANDVNDVLKSKQISLSESNKTKEPITEVIVPKKIEPIPTVVTKVQPVKDEVNVEKIVDDNYQIEAVEGVSDDLLARFQAAMDETQLETTQPLNIEDDKDDENNIQPLTQMPAWVQNGVPTLHFEQHIYASNGQGWVNVNGRDRYQGDMIAPDLQLSEILPQQVILEYRGEVFSLPALTNW
jgi:type II secretory pathway predicted ATPase ExeA